MFDKADFFTVDAYGSKGAESVWLVFSYRQNRPLYGCLPSNGTIRAHGFGVVGGALLSYMHEPWITYGQPAAPTLRP